ncbi:MAG: hypothetical protein DYH20_05350 [Gammaproteobacteria bacterium PRO9]|nr:hypothetical protein [Gammaproteobacteria bacterium PRO9]
MTPLEIIMTAVALAFFVLAGGCYGGLYAAAMLRSSRQLMQAAYACYAVQLVLTGLVWTYSGLATGWKVLILVSVIGYAWVPAVTWRYMHILHRNEGQTT